MSLRSGALFAGYGGLDLAVENVFGATTAWVADVCGEPDKGRPHKEPHGAPCSILAHRFPGAPNHGDVTQIDWAAVEPVDILTGGSPCQDLSHAGKRAGMKAGTRSGLWASMCDAIETIRPRFVVWENVRGALSAEADSAVEPCSLCVGDGRGVTLRALGRVLGDLAELGYDACWTGLRAADVGAPHGRFRVFVLAWDASRPAGLGGRAAPADAGGEARLVGPGLRANDASGDRRGLAARGGRPAAPLMPTPAARDYKGRSLPSRRGGQGLSDALLPTPVTEPTTGNGHARNLGAEVRVLLPTPRATDGTKGGPNQRGSSGDLMLPSAVLLPTPTATDRRSSGSTYAGTDTHHQGVTLTDATVRQTDAFGQYAPAIARWEAVLGRPAPAPTEPTGKGGAHRLSPRFVEWMMGLPDGWVTDPAIWEQEVPTPTHGVNVRAVPAGARNAQLKALGNGVMPQQASAALRHMLTLRAAALEGVAA